MSKIKIHDPFFGKEEKLAINAVLESHQWASSKGNNKVSELVYANDSCFDPYSKY